MAGFVSLANGRKTWYYLKKNGIKSACLAVLERLEQQKQPAYSYVAPAKEVLCAQRTAALANTQPVRFSILVPAYETKKEYLTALLCSVYEQSWPYWELVIADAGCSGQVYETICAWAKEQGVPVKVEQDGAQKQQFCAGLIRYVRLSENRGISENTNAALAFAWGDYTGLLDHDDLLCADALFEMAAAIERERMAGRTADAVYSDEDKCDGDAKVFYEPHLKTDFDPELLLTNNYICHFLAMKTEWLKRLKLRPAYNGAQDFDLVLRAHLSGARFAHVSKVLYHWRCHTESTAENPRSKAYAYEAGKRAVEDFCRQKGWQVTVKDTAHLGFYRVEYANLWRDRPEIGAVVRPIHKKGRMVSGIYEKDGKCRFAGLRSGFSGYIHRAVLQQSAPFADVRQMCVRPSREKEWLEAVSACRSQDPILISAEFCSRLAEDNMRILWDPAGKEAPGSKEK